MPEPWNKFYERTRTRISWPLIERDHDAFLHAVGSISQQWNFLEDTFFTFLVFGKIPDGVARYLGFRMNNNDKIEIMKTLAEGFETDDPESFQRARVFFAYARMCAENRNFVVHSILKGTENGRFKLTKRSRNRIGQYNTIKIGIDDLRGMAQEMSNTAQFGARLQVVMLRFQNRLAATQDGKLFHVELLDPPPEPSRWEDFR